MGTAGFVIIGQDGKEIERVAVRLQEGMTNNEAEATSLHLALKRIAELEDSKHPQFSNAIRVFGDSQLVIKWHLGVFRRISKASIYQEIMGAK